MPSNAAASTSILKAVSAYPEEGADDPDSRFFPTEERPPIASLPIPAVRPSPSPVLSWFETDLVSLSQTSDPMEDDYDDPDGSLFSGPAARSVPTSTSTFRMRTRSRGDLDRMSRELSRTRAEEDDARSVGGKSRRSKRSKRRASRRGSDATTAASETGGESEAESVTSAAHSRKSKSSTRRKSTDRDRRASQSRGRRGTSRSSRPAVSDDEEDDEARPGFFSGISAALRGRRSTSRAESVASGDSRPASVSRSRVRRRSSEVDEDAVSFQSESEAAEEDDDPYGPYGSSDSTSTTTSNSSSSQDDGPRRRRGGGGFLNLPGGGEDFFGESRIDFEDGDDDGDADSIADGLSPDDRRKRPSNAHQPLYIPDEDLPLKLFGFKVSKAKLVAWTAGCVLSGGSLWLLGRWVPNVWLKGVGEPGEFEEALFVVVEVRSFILSIQTTSSNALFFFSDGPPPTSDPPHPNPHPRSTSPSFSHLPSLCRHPSRPPRRRIPSRLHCS